MMPTVEETLASYLLQGKTLSEGSGHAIRATTKQLMLDKQGICFAHNGCVANIPGRSAERSGPGAGFVPISSSQYSPYFLLGRVELLPTVILGSLSRTQALWDLVNGIFLNPGKVSLLKQGVSCLP